MTLFELLPELPGVYVSIVVADFLRYFVVVTLVYYLVWRVFAKVLASRKILQNDPKHGQMLREFKNSLLTVLVFGTVGFSIFILEKLGYTRIYSDIQTLGWVWWWTSLAFIIVAHDAWFYWTHRLLHRPWWFARIHSVHHQSVHPTPWAAYSFHPVEAAIQAVFFLGMVLLVPMHPWVLFAFTSWMIVRNAVGHCSYELMPWRMATKGSLRWLVTNSHHHYHHAKNKGNFGLYFTWWDRWMDTEDTRYIAAGDALFLQTKSVKPVQELS
jgi:Delta7-sterol 5-desaturase